MPLMVSISGVRGIVGETLIPETVVRYASAFAEWSGKGTVLLGRDGRIGGKIFANIISSTVLAMGCDVQAIGICPTPTLLFAAKKFSSPAIAVTASHNPSQWNGMKFISKEGMFLDKDESKTFWEIANSPTRKYAAWNQIGKHSSNENILSQHLDAILSLPYLNIETIQKRKFKVVIDCVNASGSLLAIPLLEKLGCEIIKIHCEESGVFPHAPEPLPENLTELRQRVIEEKADVGFALDPDADRVAIIMENGEAFSEEYTVVACSKLVLNRNSQIENRKSVVVNLSTTKAIEDIANENNATLMRTPVGEINVSKKMKELNAIVGGEGSGGIILPELHWGRDGSLGIALFLQLLSEFNGTVSELKNSLPKYSMKKTKLEIGNLNANEITQSLAEKYSAKAKINLEDGIRLDFPEGWIHIRPSNTEPILRIIAESPSEKLTEHFIQQTTKEILNLKS
ncbi:MAG: phosphoglucosamine mutase [Ignavibacteriales bacterium]|nr:phosphoglucosamine mutase [Ignavibacteriales bacterium]